MRIWLALLAGTALSALAPNKLSAQAVTTNGNRAVLRGPVPNTAPAVPNATPVITPQDVVPTPAVPDATPMITPQDVVPTPAVPDATPVITPQDVAPNLFGSNATPALGRQNITPVMPSPGVPAIIPQSPGAAIGTNFTTGIGQQGSGTAIGQQGNTAIGQQGVGTAIFPETNAVIIGQPEPFTPPAPAVTPPVGVTGNLTNALGQAVVPVPGGGFTNMPRGTAITPPTPIPTPTGRR